MNLVYRNQIEKKASIDPGHAAIAALAAGALYGGYQGYRHGKEVHPEDKAHIGRGIVGAMFNAPLGLYYQMDRSSYKKWNEAADKGIPHKRDMAEGWNSGALGRPYDPRMVNNEAYKNQYGENIKEFKASEISGNHKPTMYAYGDSLDAEDDIANIDHHPELSRIANKVSKKLHGVSFGDVHPQHVSGIMDGVLAHPDYNKYLQKVHEIKLKNRALERVASGIDSISSQLAASNLREGLRDIRDI